MNRCAAMLLIGVLAMPASALAVDAQPEPSAPVAEASREERLDDGDRMICKNEQVIGSRQTKRVCTTVDQARAHREAGRNYTDQGVNRLQDVKAGD